MMQHWFTEEGKLNSEKESRRFQTTRTSQRDHAFSKGSEFGIVLDDENLTRQMQKQTGKMGYHHPLRLEREGPRDLFIADHEDLRDCQPPHGSNTKKSHRMELHHSHARQVLSTHDTNTPHRAEANRIAEGADRRVKDGTATAMVQSGLPDQWWDCAMECSCNLRNEHDKMADGKTADGKTSGVKLDGLLIPFGAKVSDKPISSNDEARLHCRRRWSGDLRIADCEDLDNLSASGVHAKRFKHQDVVQEGTLLFFCADGPLILFDLPQLPRAQGKPLAI